MLPDGVPDGGVDLVHVEGFGDVGVGALVQRGHRGLQAGVARDQDEARFGLDLLEAFQNLKPAPVRQPQVRDHHVRRVLLYVFDSSLGLVTGDHSVAGLLQIGDQSSPHPALVVHHQDRCRIQSHGVGSDTVCSTKVKRFSRSRGL